MNHHLNKASQARATTVTQASTQNLIQFQLQ